MKSNINFTTIKTILYREGFHILVCSDLQVRKLSGFSPTHCREKNSISGLIIPDRNEIIINKSLILQERVLTLVHELIHLVDPKLSEKQTEASAQTLYTKLSDRSLGFLEFAVSHSS